MPLMLMLETLYFDKKTYQNKLFILLSLNVYIISLKLCG